MIKWFTKLNLGSVLTQLYSDIFTLSDAIDESLDSLDERVSSLEGFNIYSYADNGILITSTSSRIENGILILDSNGGGN